MKSKQILLLCIITIFAGILAGCDQVSDLLKPPARPASYEVYSFMLSIQDAEAFQFRFAEIANPAIEFKASQDIPYSVQYIRDGDLEVIFGAGPSREKMTEFGQGEVYRGVEELLAELGSSPENIDIVVLDHKHFDGIGNVPLFTTAQFLIQKREWEAPADDFTFPDEIASLQQLQQAGRLRIIEGDLELAPGINLYLIPGHTSGQMAMTVNTEDGQVTLSGDAIFTYENLEYGVPGAIGVSPEEQLQGQQRLKGILGASTDFLVPMHDLEVYQRFPKVADRIVRIKPPVKIMSLDERLIRLVDYKYHKAWTETADMNVIESLWSHKDDVLYIDFEGNRYEGWEAVKAYHQSVFEQFGGPIMFYVSEPVITIVGDKATYKAQWGMAPDALDMKSTMLFRKEDGQWVIYSVDDTK